MRTRTLARAVSAGRKREFAAFGWDPETIPDPQELETFARSKLKWQELSQAPHREILEWHRESDSVCAPGRRSYAMDAWT